MPRTWGQVFWPSGAPLWVAICGNTSLAIVLASIVLLLLPRSATSKHKVLRRLRAPILRGGRNFGAMFSKGPFYKFFVFFCKRVCRGRLSSACQPPEKLRAQGSHCSEIMLTFTPRLPSNVFHEEHYVLQWRRDPSASKDPGEETSDADWQERRLDRQGEVEDMGASRRRIFVDKLLEHACIQIRLCAESAWGRSAWSDVCSAETLLRPCVAGGSKGPLGSAAHEPGATYRWTQNEREVQLKVPIGRNSKARDFFIKATATKLDIRLRQAGVAGEEGMELLVGLFPKKIKADDVEWQIEDSDEHGRHIAVQLVKAEAMAKWPCLVELPGHPRIDTSYLRFYTKGLQLGGGGPFGGLDLYE